MLIAGPYTWALTSGSAGVVDTQALPKIGTTCVSDRGSMFCNGLLMNPMKLEKPRLLAGGSACAGPMPAAGNPDQPSAAEAKGGVGGASRTGAGVTIPWADTPDPASSKISRHSR